MKNYNPLNPLLCDCPRFRLTLNALKMQKMQCFIEKNVMCVMKKRPAFVYHTDRKETLRVYKDIRLNNENTLRAILADMGPQAPPAGNRHQIIQAITDYFVFETDYDTR